MTSKRAQDASQHQLIHLIKDALRRASRSLHMRLAEHSVSLGHWTFLRIHWVDDGLTQSELSERAGLMQPTTFFAVNGMEQLGYIRREKLPGSRRNVHIFLTTAGRALRKKLAPYASEIDALAVAGLSSRDIAVTRRTLLAVIQNLADDEQEGLKKKAPRPLDAGNLALHAHLTIGKAPTSRPAPRCWQPRHANGSQDLPDAAVNRLTPSYFSP